MPRTIPQHMPVYARNMDTADDIERKILAGGTEKGP
jgi:hypothetical protein